MTVFLAPAGEPASDSMHERISRAEPPAQPTCGTADRPHQCFDVAADVLQLALHEYGTDRVSHVKTNSTCGAKRHSHYRNATPGRLK